MRNSDGSDLLPITDLTKSCDAEMIEMCCLTLQSNCFKIYLCAQTACVLGSWVVTNYHKSEVVSLLAMGSSSS